MDARERARKLYEVEHLTPAQIAIKLGIAQGTVRQWKCRDRWGEERNVTAKPVSRRQAAEKLTNNSELDELEKDFCAHYAHCLNATVAAMRAGHYSTRHSAAQGGHRMMRKAAVVAEIKRLLAQKRENILAIGADVIEMHMRIAFSDLNDFITWGRESVPVMGMFGPMTVTDPNTGETSELKQDVNMVKFRNSELVDGQLVAEIKQSKSGVSIKLADKQKSLDFLERYFVLNPMDQHRIDFDNRKLELEQRKAEEDSRRPLGGVVIPDAVWRSLMNPVYADRLLAKQQLQIFFGGSSSGKSFAIEGQRVIRDVMTGKHNYLICRKVGRTIRRSCFNEVWKCVARMDLENEFSRNITEMVITHKASGCQIFFSGLDDVEKIKSITPEKGVLTDVLVEEATEIDYDDYKQLSKRLRGETDDPGQVKRIILLFNPIDQSHWIYTTFFAGKWDDSRNSYQDDDLLILRTTYKDNRFLTESDIKLLENETDRYYYEVYTLGHWGVLGNLIFTNWRAQDLSELAKATNHFYNGLDFGFFPDPAAFVRCSYNRAKKEVYVFLTTGGTDMTNDMLAEKLKPVIRREVVTCDSAEPKSIQELCNFGLNAVPAVKGPGSLGFGIKWLQRQTILIDPRCVDLILEFKKYKYREDKNGQVLPEPVDRDNHYCDGLRYALEHTMVEMRVS